MSTKRELVIRTGCLACRARGKRCNPDNPECQRYTSTKWDSNRGRAQRDIDANANAAALWIDNTTGFYNSEYSWNGTIRERQSLHFFSVISAPELSGLLDAKFWQMLLLQATHADDAIKHAVAALGAFHEHQLRRQVSRINAETDGLHPFAIRQCNKAISALIKPAKNTVQQDITRALTASVLFACFESLGGNKQAATPHIVHSRRLLEQHKKEQNKADRTHKLEAFPMNMDIIEPIVSHLEAQVGDYMGEAEPKGRIKVFNVRDPLEFDRLPEARITLEMAIASVGALYLNAAAQGRTIGDLNPTRREYWDWFLRWDVAFSEFLSRESRTMDRETLDGCRLLKSHQLAALTLTGVAYGKGEEAWATFVPEFRAIVELISEIVANLPKKGMSASVPQVPYLSATMGMTEPLYCTATRCTEAEIAEKARNLLTKLPLNEGAHSKWKLDYIEKNLCAATGKPHPALFDDQKTEVDGD